MDPDRDCYKPADLSIDFSDCFKYYLNFWGFGLINTFPQDPKNMKILNLCVGILVLVLLFFIIYMHYLAIKKRKKLKKFFNKIEDA